MTDSNPFDELGPLDFDIDGDCTCGHVLDEHDPKSGSCPIDGCLCGCFEPAGSE